MTDTSLALVERLIAFDTTSRGSNLALIDFAQELLEAAGARCRRTYDPGRAKATLGWEPKIPWDETLDSVLADWRQRVRA